MELIEANKIEDQYILTFKAETAMEVEIATVLFSFGFKGKLATDLLDIKSTKDRLRSLCYEADDDVTFPLDIKQSLKCIAIHIPDVTIRSMFKAVIDFIALKNAMPLNVSFTEHPQYPVTVLTYNWKRLYVKEIETLIPIVMAAIQDAEITVEVKEVEEQENSEDTLDNYDNLTDEQIVEFSLDKEVQELIKKERVVTILPMESDKDD